MRLLVVMGVLASMASLALGLLITGSRGGSEEAKQERDSRMVKDFQPFSHPANKYKKDEGTTDVSFSGPIANIQWIGGMLLPIFGPLSILPKPGYSKDETKDGMKPSLIILGITIVLGGFIARKYGGSDKEKEKADKAKHENERNHLEECVPKIVLKKIEIDSRKDSEKKQISGMNNSYKKVELEDDKKAMPCENGEQKDLKVVRYVSDIMKASAIKADNDANGVKLPESPDIGTDVKDILDTHITQKFEKENALPQQEVGIPETEKPTQIESGILEAIYPRKSDLIQDLIKSSSESTISSSEGTITPSELSDDTITITQEIVNKSEDVRIPSEEIISITTKMVNHSEPLENSITLTKETISRTNGSVTLQEEVLTLSEETAALLEETILPFSDKLLEATKSDKKSKSQLSKENQYAKDEELEETNYNKPLKSFRMTKYPSTRAADLNLSLNEDYLIVSMVVQLQSTAQMKAGAKTEEANIGIEGANISRLRITEVKQKDELELTSKTMTVKVIDEMSKVIEDMDQVMEHIEKHEIKNVICKSEATKKSNLMKTSIWDNDDVFNLNKPKKSVNICTVEDDLNPCVENKPSISEDMKLQLQKMEDLIKEILKDI